AELRFEGGQGDGTCRSVQGGFQLLEVHLRLLHRESCEAQGQRRGLASAGSRAEGREFQELESSSRWFAYLIRWISSFQLCRPSGGSLDPVCGNEGDHQS